MPELILFTPGPVRIPERVANALSNPPCNYHRQEAFTSMFVETERMLKQLIGIKQADAYFATVMTATGMFGWCFETYASTARPSPSAC